MQLKEFIQLSDRLQNQYMKTVEVESPFGPEKVRIFAQGAYPLRPDQEIVLLPYTGVFLPAPDGTVEVLEVGDLREWYQSFDDREDPAQELIDYINSLNAETE